MGSGQYAECSWQQGEKTEALAKVVVALAYSLILPLPSDDCILPSADRSLIRRSAYRPLPTISLGG